MDVAYLLVALVGPLMGVVYVLNMLFHLRNTSPAQPVEPKRPAISPAMRAEIEQTQDWWDREYHRMIKKANSETFVVTREGEVIYEMSFGSTAINTHTTRNYGYYPTCPCPECLYGRRAAA